MSPNEFDENDRRAYERGVQSERTQQKLESHERRLNAINGSVERMSKAVEGLGDRFDEAEAQQRTRDAISEALRNEFRKANEKQISTRMFLTGVGAIMATIFCGIVSSHLL